MHFSKCILSPVIVSDPKTYNCSQIPLRILSTPLFKNGISFSWEKNMQFQGFDFFPCFSVAILMTRNELEVLEDKIEKKIVTCRNFRIYIHNYTVSPPAYSICAIRNGQLEVGTWSPVLFQSLKVNHNLAGSISTCSCIMPGRKYFQHLGRN